MKKLFVLLADDDKDDRFFFDKALQCLSFPTDFKEVADGEELIDWLLVNKDSLPDVLFLDINMPRKNGVECLVEIKKNPKFNSLPVVMYSTSLMESVADSLYYCGATYYIQKTDFTDLPLLLEKALKLIDKSGCKQPPRNEFILRTKKHDDYI